MKLQKIADFIILVIGKKGDKRKMTKKEITEITKHIEIHARREPHAIHITEILRKAVVELVLLQEENAELKKWQKDTIKARGKDYMDWSKMKDQLTKAKEIIKDFLLMAKVEHLKDRYETVDEAEQFLKEVE